LGDSSKATATASRLVAKKGGEDVNTETTREAVEDEIMVYVYGVVPADVETDPGAVGIGDPPCRVSLVHHDGIAALVSEIPYGRRLGSPQDLSAHARLLDAAAAEVPVLPLRFGEMVPGRDALTREFLAPHQGEFEDALRALEGRVEYIVKGRYVEEAILREVLAEDGEAARLRDRIRDKPQAATRDERIALGEIISQAVAAKRDADTRELIDALGPLGFELRVREPTHEEDAVYVACLVEKSRTPELQDAVRTFALAQEGRVNVRLLGPLAAYDFVTTRRGTDE
jgi:hypothetical protein